MIWKGAGNMPILLLQSVIDLSLDGRADSCELRSGREAIEKAARWKIQKCATIQRCRRGRCATVTLDHLMILIAIV